MTDSMKKRPRKRFSAEFQHEAVELLRRSGMTAAQVSAELEVSESALYRWANAREKSTDYVQENKALKRELRRVRQELAFLKKASRYFAMQSSTGIGL